MPSASSPKSPGLGIPVVVLFFVNTALAHRAPFQQSVNRLRAEGVQVLLGPGQFVSHPSASAEDRVDMFPLANCHWEKQVRENPPLWARCRSPEKVALYLRGR